MMDRILLPTLRGDDSLGFLAALGLLSLAEQGELSPLRLGWEGRGSPLAAVEGPSSLDDLARELQDMFARLDQNKCVLPNVPLDFPLPSPGTGRDLMRMTRQRAADPYGQFREMWFMDGNRWPARWLVAIAGQTGSRRDHDEVALTPFYAPTGQMKMRSSMFEFAVAGVKGIGPPAPADALTGWRRRSGYAGANFDQRALRDGTVATSGRPENVGAPSPTWLAAMAIRFFPMADDGRETAAVGWQRVALYPGYTRRSLVWPVWRPALDPCAIRALLAHPALAVEERERYEVAALHPGHLDGLGVFGLFGASRRTLTQGDGPLGPTRRIWSSL